MVKDFFNIETGQSISVEDNAVLSDFPGYTDVVPPLSKTTEQLRADFRHLRDSLLYYTDTDNAMASDHPDNAALLTFRQKLRDAPQDIPSFELGSGSYFTEWETGKFQEIFSAHAGTIRAGFS